MICRTCFDDPCTCSEVAARPVIRSTERSIPPGITREEFGLELYEAVKVCGGILQLRDLQKKADAKRRGEYKQRESIMWQQLSEVTPKLPVQAQQELIERYQRLFAGFINTSNLKERP